ncbi:hypothetical protein EON82_16500 [bacterium]|nr:MAG: hypothetical protein EON82_16500 [bacterium]
MNTAIGALVLLVGSAPVTLKRSPKPDDRASYAMKALIELPGQDGIRFTGTWNEKVRSVEAGKVTTAVESRVSVDVLGIVRQSAMISSDRVETLDGALITASKVDPTLLFGVPRVDRLRSFYFPSGPVEIGNAWWHTSPANGDLKAPPSASYLKLEGEEKIGQRETWRASVDAHEVDDPNPVNVKGMLWLDKNDGSLVRGQWTIQGFVRDAQTPPMSARIEFSRTN